MESPRALWGHSKSMSSLATVIPLPTALRRWSASTPHLTSSPLLGLPDELSIPLPPSRPGSDYGEEEVEATRFSEHISEPDRLREDRTAKPAAETNAFIHTPGTGQEEDSSDRACTSQEQDLSVPIVSQIPSNPPEKQPALPMALIDILDLIQKEAYEHERTCRLRNQVLELLRLCGNTNRSLLVKRYLYRHMVESFRMEKKNTFASLFSQSLMLKIGPVLIPNLSYQVQNHDFHLQPELASWFVALSLDSQQSITLFLQNLRNDSSNLADRLVNLSSSQLSSLARPHRLPLTSEPGLDTNPTYSRFDPRNFRQKLSKAAEQSQGPSFLFKDPLLLLIGGIFDQSAPWGTPERVRQLDVWSSACAQIIQDGKPGADEFCLVVLDLFADMCPWNLKPRLELFLEDLIHSGQFLLDVHPDQQFKEGSPGEFNYTETLAVKSSNFFNEALKNLIELVTNPFFPIGVPLAALDLIHATLRKINGPERRKKAKGFFSSRWFCTSFLSNALLYPERHQLLLRSHVSTVVRHKIFRELAVRLQKALYLALSPNNSTLELSSPTADEGSQRLLALFEPPESVKCNRTLNPVASQNDRPYILLTANDIEIIAKTLYPEESLELIKDNCHGQPTSMSSSYTGSTTLTAGTNGPRTRTSSTVPSISGTSVTSTTFSSELLFNNFDKNAGSARTIEIPYRSRPETSSGTSTIHHDQIHKFLPELSLQVNRLMSSSSKKPYDDLLLYIHPYNGSLHTTIESLQLEDKPQTSNRFTNHSDLSIPASDRDILHRALSQASLTRKALDHTEHYLSSSQPSSLDALFEGLLTTCDSRLNFSAAHFWSRTLSIVTSLSTEKKSELIGELAVSCRESTHEQQTKAILYNKWLSSLEEVQVQQQELNQHMMLQFDALRHKMWFCIDVKHSSHYENTMNVMRALRSMAYPFRPKQTGVAAWARQRFRTSFGQDRNQAQVLEALSAPNEHGGPNKLADAQADLMLSWLNRESIENFCKGEERIHRFCFEVQKCVKKLVAEGVLESPILWSSCLYQNERVEFYGASESSSSHNVQQQHLAWTTNFAFADNHGISNVRSQSTNATPGLGVLLPNQGHHSLPFSRSRETPGPLQDPGIFPPPSQSGPQLGLPRDWTLPPSPVSPASSKEVTDTVRTSRTKFIEKLRQTLTSLLLSDFGLSLWAGGSETDLWVNDDRVPMAFERAYDEYVKPPDQNCAAIETHRGYCYSVDDGYQLLLKRFRVSFDPWAKLESLVQLTELVASKAPPNGASNNDYPTSPLSDSTLVRGISSTGVHGLGLPRTRLTRLEEVSANCEERRLMSLGLLPTTNGTYNPSSMGHALNNTGLDRATAILRALVLDNRYRPSTLYRDLQLIAAFVPSSMLDRSAKGTAFWDIGLAAMTLKSETCKIITSQATEILAHHLSNGNRQEPTRSEGSASTSPSRKTDHKISQEDLSRTSLQDAARLYTISALEGDPTAARELGLLYLTHPELVKRVTLPLSKPGEIFRSNFTLGNGDRTKDGDGVLEPATFAVAFHWMEFAANAGDEDARTFFRENSELGRGL